MSDDGGPASLLPDTVGLAFFPLLHGTVSLTTMRTTPDVDDDEGRSNTDGLPFDGAPGTFMCALGDSAAICTVTLDGRRVQDHRHERLAGSSLPPTAPRWTCRTPTTCTTASG